MSLSATVIRDILYSATSYGTAYDQLAQLGGFSNEQMTDSEKMVELDKAMNLWKLIGQITGLERIGLKFGQQMNIRMLGMVGFLMQSSATVEQSMEMFCKYSYVVCPMIEFKYMKHGRTAVFELYQNQLWLTKYPHDSWENIDFALTCCVNFTRALTGSNIIPVSVTTRAPKKSVQEYQNYFQCPVSFNADVARLVFSIEDVHKSVLSFDKPLFELFDSILAQKKDAFMLNSCSKALKQQLIMRFKGQIPTIEEAAASMNMTIRTLQRKLMEEKSSYRSITNEVKKEIALQLMKAPSHNITEVASLLGYSDLPAFRRAFKSWTQETPKTVKRKLLKEAV